MSQCPTRTEVADQLRCDITVLRALLDAALAHGRDEALIDVCATMLRERREQLEELDAAAAARAVRAA